MFIANIGAYILKEGLNSKIKKILPVFFKQIISIPQIFHL